MNTNKLFVNFLIIINPIKRIPVIAQDLKRLYLRQPLINTLINTL